MNKELAIECIKTQRQFVDDMTREAFDMAIDLIKEAKPSADVVPVVRCGDCLFCQMELGDGADEPWCDMHHTMVDTEAFCSWGERKRHED